MRNRSTFLLPVLLLFAIVVGTKAQEGDKQRFSAKLQGRGFVTFTTETNPAISDSQIVGSITAEQNIIHRVILDREGRFFFGYDVQFEPIQETKQFTVYIQPLSKEFERQLRQKDWFKRIIKHPNPNSVPYSFATPLAPQVVQDGDTLALDILVNPQTGVKIVDLINVSSDGRQEALESGGPPRDFSLDDVKLTVTDFKLLVNGELTAGGGKASGGCSGGIIWFYLPSRGRFIFSLLPRKGYDFQNIAVVKHKKIFFAYGGNSYEWASSSPIIGSEGNWNLWVLADPRFQPESGALLSEQNLTFQKRMELKARFGLETDAELADFLKRTGYVIGSASRIEFLFR